MSRSNRTGRSILSRPDIPCLAVACLTFGLESPAAEAPAAPSRSCSFDRTISREVLENYLSRAITMEGLLNGRGDLDDNIRMLKGIGAKFIGRSLCLWGGEANLLAQPRAGQGAAPQGPRGRPGHDPPGLHLRDRDHPGRRRSPCRTGPSRRWASRSEKRNFRYADMLYPDGRFKDHWRAGQSVPDVSRPGNQALVLFPRAPRSSTSGCEAIHLGQTELMNRNDRNLDHYAAGARPDPRPRRQPRPPAHGAVRLPRPQRRPGARWAAAHGLPLLPAPDHGGARTSRRRRSSRWASPTASTAGSKGGTTFSGWKCEHLPYLVEIDNWGVSRAPGQAEGRAASGSGATTRSPGSRTRAGSTARTGCATPGTGCGGRIPTAISRCPAAGPWRRPLDGQALVLRQQPEPGGPGRLRRRRGDPGHLGSTTAK